MIDVPDQIVTGYLTDAQLWEEAAAVVAALQELGIPQVRVFHWGGETEIQVEALLAAFELGFEDNKGRPLRWELGSSDFTIYMDGLPLEFEFCHESELHVRQADEAVREKFSRRWRERNHEGYRWDAGVRTGL